MTIRAPRGEDCQQRLSSMKNTPSTAAKAAATAPAVPSVRTMSQQLWHLAAALMAALLTPATLLAQAATEATEKCYFCKSENLKIEPATCELPPQVTCLDCKRTYSIGEALGHVYNESHVCTRCGNDDLAYCSLQVGRTKMGDTDMIVCSFGHAGKGEFSIYLQNASDPDFRLRSENFIQKMCSDPAVFPISTFPLTDEKIIVAYFKPGDYNPIMCCYIEKDKIESLPYIKDLPQEQMTLDLPNVDNTRWDNTWRIESFDGFTCRALLNGRTLYKDGSWNTLYVPFDITDGDADDDHPASSGGADGKSFTGTPIEGAEVKTLEATSFNPSTGTLTLTFSPGSLTLIEAGKPYIVRWDKAEGYDNAPASTRDVSSPLFTHVTISNAAHTIATSHADFFGSYRFYYLDKDDTSLLYLGSDNKLCYSTKNTFTGSFRGFFRLKGLTADAASQQVRAVVANFGDGHTSAIHEATGSRPDLNPTGWYDLSGRKIADGPAAATLPHGIYLHQGRKVVK